MDGLVTYPVDYPIMLHDPATGICTCSVCGAVIEQVTFNEPPSPLYQTDPPCRIEPLPGVVYQPCGHGH
jgi:hypothetical protein